MTVVRRNAGVGRWNRCCCYGENICALGDLVAEVVDHQRWLQCSGSGRSCAAVLRGCSYQTKSNLNTTPYQLSSILADVIV